MGRQAKKAFRRALVVHLGAHGRGETARSRGCGHKHNLLHMMVPAILDETICSAAPPWDGESFADLQLSAILVELHSHWLRHIGDVFTSSKTRAAGIEDVLVAEYVKQKEEQLFTT